ncbi:MAG: phytanoyl-CoA dioxygenase family protein [Novosphingobium sp.]|nr:phytanoyl-CoA dioxygenase family protein [Novosphingobium sp.]
MTAVDIAGLKDAFERDGVIHVPGLLTPQQLADATAAYEWTRDHRGPGYTPFPGDPNSWQDLSNPDAYAAYGEMLARSPLPALLQGLWGGGPVWYMYEQIFHKQGTTNRTPWHQDTSYMPIDGKQLGVVWISLDPVSPEETLEYCLGSHKGPLYNGTTFKPGDPTDPLYKSGDMPRLPDVDADRSAWNIQGWASQPGDVVVFHPSVLHGGGAPGMTGRRRTLTLRFFGEDAIYSARPGPTAAPRIDGLHDLLDEGDPFRHPVFPKLA